ncbi:MAG: YqgE/AlgH family protein [Deltaproteobacteria bacterium]|nr:MAG: YqgE/AlgH family protein [Deltaproteobacteria bacterium]
MRDTFFEETVILLWHHDEDGAIGIVVNRPLEHPLSEVLEGPPVHDYPGAWVAWGGPVERSSGTAVLRGEVDDEEGWTLPCRVGITRSEDRLRRAIEEQTELLLCLGYAGWGPGQLDREIEDGSWLYTDVSDQLVFDTPSDKVYERALWTLGLTPSTVLMDPGDA